MQEEIIGRPSCRRFRLFCAALLALSVLITAVPFGFSARAVEIDGLLKEKMWAEAEPFTVIRLRDQPNCSVDEAKIFVCFDERNLVTYIGCRLLHQKPSAVSAAEGEAAEEPQILSGVAVRVEGDEFMTFTAQRAEERDSAAYRVQGAAAPLSDTSTTAEILIGQKNGFQDPLLLQLFFLDADGRSSNVYSLSIPSPTPPTTPLVVTTVGETTTAPPKTAKPTTSRTQKETQPTAQRTTQVKTTVEKTTVEKTTKEKTTKEKTTKLKTTKVKTTKAPRTTKPKTTAAKTAKAAAATLSSAGDEKLLQALLAEQAKTKRILYVGAGVLVFAVIAVGAYLLKKRDE